MTLKGLQISTKLVLLGIGGCVVFLWGGEELCHLWKHGSVKHE